MMKKLRDWFCAKAKDTEGSSTIPFVMYVPFFMILVLSSFELGLYALRDVVLDRAVSLTVRNLRLGAWENPDHDIIRDDICKNAAIISDCANVLKVELTPVSKDTWGPLPSESATCVDRSATVQPVTTISDGTGGDLMFLRACVKVKPFVPTTGLALNLTRDKAGDYALVVTTIFVNEPV